MNRWRGTSDEGEPEDVRELRTMADTVREALVDASQIAHGDEPMTGAQRSYLETLAREAGEQLPADLTKAQASEHIDRLQARTGRGQ